MSVSNNRHLHRFIGLFCLGTVRIFGSEDKITKKYNDDVFKSFVVGKKIAFNNELFAGVLQLLTAFGMSAVMW